MEEDERESSPLRPLPHNGGDTTSIYQLPYFKSLPLNAAYKSE